MNNERFELYRIRGPFCDRKEKDGTESGERKKRIPQLCDYFVDQGNSKVQKWPSEQIACRVQKCPIRAMELVKKPGPESIGV